MLAMTRLSYLAAVLALALICSSSTGRAEDVDYIRDVKPIFAKHCAKCHQAEKQESGLRLDLGGGVLRGGDGGPIVVAGDAANSRLLKIVRGADEDVERMPPEGEPLSAKEIATIEAWVAAGANVPEAEMKLEIESEHWSFQTPARPALPSVDKSAAVRNAIDYFVVKTHGEIR